MVNQNKEILKELQLLIDNKGEQFVREYLYTYCEIMLEDPSLSSNFKNKIKTIIVFIKNKSSYQ